MDNCFVKSCLECVYASLVRCACSGFWKSQYRVLSGLLIQLEPDLHCSNCHQKIW